MTTFVPARGGPVPLWVDRTLALSVVLLCTSVVVALLAVQPDARGYGTHEQLGMRPCGWPELYGMPCPTCGVTTAACYLVHLRPWQAVVTQPFGAALAAVGLAVAGTALLDVLRGRSFVARVYELRLARWCLGGAALLLLSWWYRVGVGV